MRFTYPITITLLASTQFAADAFREDAKLRILKRIEAGGMPKPSSPERILNNKGGNGGGNGGGGNKSNSGGGGGGSSGYTKSDGRGGNPHKTHSAHLDANDNGIHADAVEYEYGTPINVDFELTNDKVPDDVLLNMNVDNMGQWKVGVFMRMADPQDGALAPIVSVTPTITDATARKLKEMKQAAFGLRGLQEATTTVAPPTTSSGSETTTTTEMPVETTREPPTLDSVGTVTIDTTDAATLSPTDYGTGFDLYLLDENGAAIMGPGTVYMIPTQAMADAEAANAGKKANHPLAKHDHASKFKNKGGKGKGPQGKGKGVGGNVGKGGTAKEWGKGSGINGNMIISTNGNIESYELMTDKMYYATGEDVVVTYDLSPEAIEEGRYNRMLQGNGKGNGKNSEETTTTSTVDATTAAATTTTTESTIDGGAGEGEEESAGTQPEIDVTDVTLFKVGVYMRMANPQGGDLLPIVSVPFCPAIDGADPGANCDADALQMGSFSFSTNELDTQSQGNGFDIWILNGANAGVAGPFTFYVDATAP